MYIHLIFFLHLIATIDILVHIYVLKSPRELRSNVCKITQVYPQNNNALLFTLICAFQCYIGPVLCGNALKRTVLRLSVRYCALLTGVQTLP